MQKQQLSAWGGETVRHAEIEPGNVTRVDFSGVHAKTKKGRGKPAQQVAKNRNMGPGTC